MKISPGRLSLWILCIFFQMTASVIAAESEFSRNLAVAENGANGMKERMAAIHYLAISGEEQALKPMLAILMNENEKEGIRCGAVRGLADLGQGRAQIISRFEQVYREPGTGENLRYTLLLSLGRMYAEESLPLLSDALSDPSEMIRFKASQAIGYIGNEPSIKLLVTHLNKEHDRMVRAEIVRALGGAKSTEARKALIQTLLSDPSSLVRWNAALTLKNCETLSPEARSAMAPALNDPSPMVRETVKGMLQ